MVENRFHDTCQAQTYNMSGSCSVTFVMVTVWEFPEQKLVYFNSLVHSSYVVATIVFLNAHDRQLAFWYADASSEVAKSLLGTHIEKDKVGIFFFKYDKSVTKVSRFHHDKRI